MYTSKGVGQKHVRWRTQQTSTRHEASLPAQKKCRKSDCVNDWTLCCPLRRGDNESLKSFEGGKHDFGRLNKHLHHTNMDRFVIWPMSRKSRGPARNKSLTTNCFYTSLSPKQLPAFHWNLNCCGAAPLELYLTYRLTCDPSLYSHKGWKKTVGIT